MACAAMCGAAREALLLALAVETMPVDEVERLYLSMGGRRALEIKVLDGMKDYVVRQFKELSRGLDFWRDNAAHGRPAKIEEPEAFRALHVLLRLAQFADNAIPQPSEGTS